LACRLSYRDWRALRMCRPGLRRAGLPQAEPSARAALFMYMGGFGNVVPTRHLPTPPVLPAAVNVTSLGTSYAELTLWGPGVRPDPFPAQPGSAMLRVTSSSEREVGNVCLRRNRRAPQALPGGGDRPGRAGPGEPERAPCGGADVEGDRRLAAGHAGRVRGLLPHQLAGGAAGGLRVRPASGAWVAVHGDSPRRS